MPGTQQKYQTQIHLLQRKTRLPKAVPPVFYLNFYPVLFLSPVPRNKKPDAPQQPLSQRTVPLKESIQESDLIDNSNGGNIQNPGASIKPNIPSVPIKKIEPPKLSARGDPIPPPKTNTPATDFVDLLDLEDPIQLKPTSNVTPGQENITKKEGANTKQKEEEKNNNPFDFDFNLLSKKETTPKKEVDQIDILFG